jgi:hypothetical protein
MHRSSALTVGSAIVLMLGMQGIAPLGEDPLTAEPEASAQTSSPAAAPVADLAFLAGAWTGDMGGYVEETWSAPQGNNIVGSFRWLKPDGTPTMFEILTITQESDATRLRLRHFSPTLSAKEEADKPMTLKLAERTGTKAVFRAEKDAGALEQIVYEVTGDTLAIDVIFAPPAPPTEAKTRKPLQFRLKRALGG